MSALWEAAYKSSWQGQKDLRGTTDIKRIDISLNLPPLYSIQWVFIGMRYKVIIYLCVNQLVLKLVAM